MIYMISTRLEDARELLVFCSSKEKVIPLRDQLDKICETTVSEVIVDFYDGFEVGSLYVIDVIERIGIECPNSPRNNVFRHPENIVVEGQHVISPISLSHAYAHAMDNDIIDRIGEYKEFELTDEQLEFLRQKSSMSDMLGVLLGEPSAKVDYIKNIAKELGFIAETVVPIKDRGVQYFKAIPK
jgi:hypothetical protein